MRVAVVDDEGNFAKKVKKDIEEFFVGQKETVKVKYFSDDSILADLQNQKYYDLYLLDVEMPEINGIILAEKVRDLDHNARIVFLTAYENYARHGYKVKAYDYLLKDSYQQYTIFHCRDGIFHKERGSLQTVLGHLPRERFILIDKGTILNLKYVVQFEKYMITLATGETLTVSRRLRSVVQEKLLDYWGEMY